MSQTSSFQVRGGGFEPPSSWFKARQPTVSRSPTVRSALRESNPPGQLGRLAPLPLGQGHEDIEAEGEGVEPSRLIARLFSRQLPSPIGLPFRIELRRQESNLRPPRLTARLPVPARAPPQCRVGAAGFEPALSCSRSRRIARLSHTLKSHESAQRESNPHFRHGKAVGYRYIMGTHRRSPNCQRDREHRVGLEPTSPHYGCGVFAARRPVLASEWDQRDSNPHLPG